MGRSDPRVVDQDVDLTILLHDAVDETLALCGVDDVRLVGPDPIPLGLEFGCDIGEAIHSSCRQGHDPPSFRAGPGERHPEAGRAAAHDDHPVLESKHVKNGHDVSFRFMESRSW